MSTDFFHTSKLHCGLCSVISRDFTSMTHQVLLLVTKILYIQVWILGPHKSDSLQFGKWR